jgi:putative salt-induced outer membrane protein
MGHDKARPPKPKTNLELPLAACRRFCFDAQARKMNKHLKILAVAGTLVALTGLASAQTTNYIINYVTVTNVVTVTVTNIVVVTNSPSLASSLPGSLMAVSAPSKKAKEDWNHSISAGLTIVRGNTDTTLMSANYEATRKTPKNEFDGTAGAAYGEQNSLQTLDNYKASFQWDHLFTSRFYNYLRADGLRDYIADVNYRLTVGPGLGYYVLKETNLTLAVEGGANFEGEDLGGNVNTFATVRLADKFEYKMGSRARFWQSVEIFPQVDKVDNYVVNFEIGMEASFTKSLSLKTCVDDNYDNRPALDHVKNDVKLVTGVAYKF